MTKVEFIASKREGMVQLYQKLDEFYKCKGTFDDLNLDEIVEMIRELDKNNFERYAEKVGYICCAECERIGIHY